MHTHTPQASYSSPPEKRKAKVVFQHLQNGISWYTFALLLIIIMFKYRKLECSTFTVLIQVEKPLYKLFQPEIKFKK